MANETARLLLRYIVDQKSLRDTIQANQAVSQSFQNVGKQQANLASTSKEVEDELAKIGRSKQIDAIALSFARGKINAEQFAKSLQGIGATSSDIRQATREAERLREAIIRARNEDAQPRSRGEQLARFGNELRMLPSVQTGLGFGTDSIANVIRVGGAASQVLDKTGVSLQSVAVAGGVAVVALGAIAIAFDIFNKSTQQLKSGMEAAVSAQNNYYQALRDNTTAQTQEQIAELQRNTELLRQQRQETRNAIGSFFVDPNENIAQAAIRLATVDGVLKAIVASGAQIPQLQEQYNKLDTEIRENEQTITRLQQGLEQGTFATNDAREAEERLAAARREAALAAADAAASDQREIGALLRGTGESAVSRRASLEDEARGLEAAIRSLQRSGETGEEVEKQLEDYRTQLDGVRSDIQTINRLLPQIRFQETLRGVPEAIKKLTQNAAEFNAETERIRAARVLSGERDQFDFIRSRQRVLADFDRQQAQAETQQVRRENELRARIAEIDSEADEQAKERTAEHNKDMLRLAEDHEDSLRQIAEDGLVAVEDAINARNSQAALAAIREQEKASKRETEQYEKQKARREQDFTDEEQARAKQSNARRIAAVQALADAQAQYKAERDLREAEFQLRIDRENEDRELRMQRQAEDFKLEDDARLAAFNKKQADIIKDAGLNGQFLNGLFTTMTNARNMISSAMQNAANNVAAAANAINNTRIQAPQVTYYNPTTGNPQVSSTGQFGANQGSAQSTPHYYRTIDGAYYDGRLIPRFAEGGITGVNRPLVGMIGDNPRYREAVIPLRPNIFRDLGVGGGRGSTVLNMSIEPGAINVVARDGQDAREIATEVVAEFAEAYTPRIIQVLKEQTA